MTNQLESLAEKQKEIIKKLEAKIGGTYLYMGRRVKLKSYEVENDFIRIYTSQGPDIGKNITKLPEVLANMMPISDPPPENQKEKVSLVDTEGSKMDKLQDTLFDSIDRLKDEPEFVDQAKEINNLAGSLIDMTKMKIELLKQASE